MANSLTPARSWSTGTSKLASIDGNSPSTRFKDSDIPATVLNAVTGEISTVQLSLAHDGEFGFTMTLSAPLGNERTEELEFQQAARIAEDGTAEFDLDHASDYAIVIDDRSHEPVDLPFNDVPEGYWAYDAVQYVYGEGLMAGTSGSTFSPESTTTRGQIVTILWRLSGSPPDGLL